MSIRNGSGGDGHPIQVVARRTGISPDLIRAWERRYGVVRPRRTDTGRRLYGETDVEKLLLVQSALAGGRRIGDIAGLSPAQLQELIRGDREARLPSVSSPPSREDADDDPHRECLDAVRNLDGEGLSVVLKRASARHGAESFLENVVAPLMHEIGDLWVQGSLHPYQEHFATAAVKKALQELMFSVPTGPGSARLVVATPAGQYHEIGALMVGAEAAIQGWKILYLGVDLPATDIATAASRFKARAVALSIIHPERDPALAAELETLGCLLPDGVQLIVGGRAAASYAVSLKKIHAARADEVRSLGDILSGTPARTNGNHPKL